MGKLLLLQGTVLLPQQATELAEPLQPVLGLLTLICLWQASQLMGRLSSKNRRLSLVAPWAIGLLLLLELSMFSSTQPVPAVELILQLGEIALLLSLARGGLRLPQAKDLKMLFQGMILLIALQLLAGAWLDHQEGPGSLHLLPCDDPLCQSLLTGLQVLPLLLLASGLLHYGKQGGHQASTG